jgi:hypothetical protein
MNPPKIPGVSMKVRHCKRSAFVCEHWNRLRKVLPNLERLWKFKFVSNARAFPGMTLMVNAMIRQTLNG